MAPGISAADARRIAHDVVGEHVDHPAPEGHKGMGRLIRQGSHEGSDNYGGKGSKRRHGAHYMPHRTHPRSGR